MKALSLPTLLLAVHTYNLVSSTEKSRMLNISLVTVLLPSGKATKERDHVKLAGVLCLALNIHTVDFVLCHPAFLEAPVSTVRLLC